MKLTYERLVNEENGIIVVSVSDDNGIVLAEGLLKVKFPKFKAKEGTEFEVPFSEYGLRTTKWVDDDGIPRESDWMVLR